MVAIAEALRARLAFLLPFAERGKAHHRPRAGQEPRNSDRLCGQFERTRLGNNRQRRPGLLVRGVGGWRDSLHGARCGCSTMWRR